MYRSIAIVIASIVSVAAFVPSSSRVARSSSSLQMGWTVNDKFADRLGVQAPLGLFDPLNLLEGADEVINLSYISQK